MKKNVLILFICIGIVNFSYGHYQYSPTLLTNTTPPCSYSINIITNECELCFTMDGIDPEDLANATVIYEVNGEEIQVDDPTNFCYIYPTIGFYEFDILIAGIEGCPEYYYEYHYEYQAETICEPACTECENSFAPLPGKKYVLNAWVKEGDLPGATTYEGSNVQLTFEGTTPSQEVILPPFKAKGQIIDGWQLIEQEFTVPLTAVKIKIALNNTRADGGDVFFDDIRIYPFNANMKSFVYDPSTLRLSAELDERNYATFYEYDEEGALIRVKKETARGTMTIQESRNSSKKTTP